VVRIGVIPLILLFLLILSVYVFDVGDMRLLIVCLCHDFVASQLFDLRWCDLILPVYTVCLTHILSVVHVMVVWLWHVAWMVLCLLITWLGYVLVCMFILWICVGLHIVCMLLYLALVIC
jgi:hypothetical protein